MPAGTSNVVVNKVVNKTFLALMSILFNTDTRFGSSYNSNAHGKNQSSKFSLTVIDFRICQKFSNVL